MATSLFVKWYNAYGQHENAGLLQERAVAKAVHLSERIHAGIVEEMAERQASEDPFEAGQIVAVIGAGFAGLASAFYLLEAGANVILFDANDRIGGRVRTLDNFIPGRLIEAGAELIGMNHSLWITLARRFGLALSPVTSEEGYVAAQLPLPVWVQQEHQPGPGGGEINQAVGVLLSTRQQQWIYENIEDAYTRLNQYAEQVDPYRPWAYSGTLPFKTVAEWIEDLEFKPDADADLGAEENGRFLPDMVAAAKTLLAAELSNDQSVPVEEQSFLGLLAAVAGGAMDQLTNKSPSHYWTHSEYYRCAAGNEALAHALLKACEDLAASGQVKFEYVPGYRAAAIGRNVIVFPSSTEEEGPAPGAPIQVEEKSEAKNPASFGTWIGGQMLNPDWIVYAGATHRERSRLHAGLGDGDAPQMGEAVKLLMQCKRRFWLAPPGSSQPCAPSAFHVDLGSFWESTDNQHGPFWDRTDPRSPKSKEGGIGLTLFAGGKMARSVSDTYRRNEFAFFNRASDLFPGLSDAHMPLAEKDDFAPKLAGLSLDLDKPDSFNPTGYSCPGPGEIERNRNLFARMRQNVVYAGEHTHPCWFGFMEGALQSGLRAAMLVTGRKLATGCMPL